VSLVFRGVSFTYPHADHPAVHDVEFELGPGEVGALIGPSGAGKSTLTRLALGLLKPDAGQVLLAGASTSTTPFVDLARSGGLVLQNPLHQLLTERVEDEILLGIRDLPPEDAQARVTQMLRAFDLEEVRERHPLLVSEGQRRRVALAAVLVRQPRVLVLDEPTLGQDERHRRALSGLVRDLAHHERTILVISHDREFVNDACERVLLLRSGQLVADLRAEDAAALRAAGVPLADVPAAALRLSEAGRPTRARTLDELVSALRVE
jgi:energy-coupling factor transport system ATP-binding protein